MSSQEDIRTVATPKAGQTVMVRHRSKTNKAGVAELQPCSKRDSVSQTIRAVYSDGRVKTMSGDVWSVKPSADSRYHWETVFGGEA